MIAKLLVHRCFNLEGSGVQTLVPPKLTKNQYLPVRGVSMVRNPQEVFNVFGQRIVALPYQDGLTVAKKGWPAGAYVVRCGLVRRILVVRH